MLSIMGNYRITSPIHIFGYQNYVDGVCNITYSSLKILSCDSYS